MTATFSAGSLILVGDSADNDVSVRVDDGALGQVTIVGNDGTTIVGPASGALTNDLTIDLGAGADTVNVTDSWTGPIGGRSALAIVRILTGNGADKVAVDGLNLRGSLIVDTGRDNDRVDLGPIHVMTVSIATGGERDRVTFGATEFVDEPDPFLIRKNFVIDTGDGQDIVESFGVAETLGLTRISTGAGSDTVSIGNAGAFNELMPLGNLTLDTGVDDDTVKLGGLRLDAVTIKTGNGNDRVYFGSNSGGPDQVRGRVSVDTGNGNDSFVVGGLNTPPVYGPSLGSTFEFDDAVTISMGAGSDLAMLENANFYDRVTIKMGAGADTVNLGKGTGGLTIDGPLLVAMSGRGGKVNVGVPGYIEEEASDVKILGFVHLNGPTTIVGGAAPATVTWHSAGASFSGGLDLVNARLVKETVNRSNLMEETKITVVDGKTGTFTDQRQRTFVTNYTVTRNAAGAVSVTPVLKTYWTGIRLDITAKISSDRRSVLIDVHLVKKTIDDPVAKKTIATPIGKQTIQLPVIRTIEGKSRVEVPDGGTILVGNLHRLKDGLADNVARKSGSTLKLMLIPRIILLDEGDSGTGSVTVEARLIEVIDRNVKGNDVTDPNE